MTSTTGDFAKTMNTVFDTVNGRHYKESITKNNWETSTGGKKKVTND